MTKKASSKIDDFFDKVGPLVERLVEVERERDLYKSKLTYLQDQLKVLSGDKVNPPQYVPLTRMQMEIAEVAFPGVPKEKAYQNYAENVLILRNEGRINNGQDTPKSAWG